jgi:hypothetical protein
MADTKQRPGPFLKSRINQFLVGFAFFSLLFLLWARAFALTPRTFRKDQFNQLYTAKTAADFAIILNAPPGDYRDVWHDFQYLYFDCPHPWPANCVCQQWLGDDVGVQGWFDSEGNKVAFCFIHPLDHTRKKLSGWQVLQRTFTKAFNKN